MKTILLTILLNLISLSAYPNTFSPKHQTTKKPQHQNTPTLQHQITKSIITSQHRSTSASTDTLPPIHQLHASIDSFYAQQTATQLLEYRESRKGEWLKFLPNFGITYTIDGQPRPSISLNSGILYQAQKARQTRAAKRRNIIETNRLEADKAKARLEELLLHYTLTKQEIAFQQKLHQVERQIYLIQEDEYHRQERAPSDYLQTKRTFLLHQQSLHEKERSLELLKMEILLTTHQNASR